MKKVVFVALASVPDLLICWVVSRVTGSGWIGFFLTLLLLWTVYFFFWLKTALWAWVMFWLYSKELFASSLEQWLATEHFPPPHKYTSDFDDYLQQIGKDKKANSELRVKAAFELGCIEGYKRVGRFTHMWQILSSGKLAIERRWPVASKLELDDWP